MSSDSNNIQTPPELSSSQLFWMVILIEGAMLIAAVLLAYFLGILFWEQMTMSGRSIGLGVASAIPMLIGVVVLDATNCKTADRLRKDFDMVIEMFQKVTILDIAFVSIMAGVCEEALFRGFIQSMLEEYLAPIPGLIIASLIFGISHCISVSYVVLVTIIGLYLGGIYLWTGDLLILMIGHAVYDFIALAYGVRIARKNRT